MPFADGHPAGMPEDVLTGFINADGDAMVARLASQSTDWARCLSLMMSATPYGE